MRALVVPVPFLACMALTATFYHLPPRVLPAIQAVEGGTVTAANRNTDGSEDLGVMQVNTIWLEPLATATRLPSATVRTRLVSEPCFNIAAAGAILRTYLNEAHGNLMVAVGYYHSHTPSRAGAYQDRVLRAASLLFAAR